MASVSHNECSWQLPGGGNGIETVARYIGSAAGDGPAVMSQAAGRDAPVSPLLGWWWAAWLLSAWVGNVGVQIFLRGQTTDELITGDWLVVVSEVIGILAIVLVFVLVQQITSNQEEKYTAREAEEESKTGPAGILARLIIGGT